MTSTRQSRRAIVLLSGAAALTVAGCPLSIEPAEIQLNSKPRANAGPPQSVAAGASVTLDASGSTDADGDALTYLWTQVAGPAATLQNGNQPQASFWPPSAGVYDFNLLVSDGVATDAATVRISVGVADGGPPAPPDPLPQAPAPPDPLMIAFTFSADAEGWSIDGRNPLWNPSGGRVGGYVSSSSEDAYDSSWWISPPLSGDWAGAYGYALEFSIRESNPSSRLAGSGQSLVFLTGGGLSIRCTVASNAARNSWSTHRIKLDPSGGWLLSGYGEADNAATADDIRAVLAGLAEIKIRARWGQQLERSTTALDEVRLLAR